MGCLVAFGIAMSLFLLWSIISPRGQWKALLSWQYRDPAANEPSDAAYTLTRLTAVVLLVAMLVSGWQLIRLAGDSPSARPGGAAASSTPDTKELLRIAFGTEAVTMATVTQASAAPGGAAATAPIEGLKPPGTLEKWPDYLTGPLAPPESANLLLLVDAAFRPVTVVVREEPKLITITLYATCVATAAVEQECGPTRIRGVGRAKVLVPVTVAARSIATTVVKDGSNGQQIPFRWA